MERRPRRTHHTRPSIATLAAAALLVALPAGPAHAGTGKGQARRTTEAVVTAFNNHQPEAAAPYLDAKSLRKLSAFLDQGHAFYNGSPDCNVVGKLVECDQNIYGGGAGSAGVVSFLFRPGKSRVAKVVINA